MNPAVRVPVAENPQRCTVSSLYRIWLTYAAGVIVFAVLGMWVALAVWVCAVPLGKWLQIRYYRYLSPSFGYGMLEEDRLAGPALGPTRATVTYYQALGCPFCPIVSGRLHALQQQMGFTLEVVDLTLQPQLLAKRGIRSVPVVEVGGRRLVGNATSEQLAALIAGAEPVRAA